MNAVRRYVGSRILRIGLEHGHLRVTRLGLRIRGINA